ncbi:SNF2 family DNA/RNA helicase (plasmid) [Azospirillum sp. B510]|uniref:DEAD/DEAH box helicase n=1 Tax=Azospirillum sp. (strain B510) TaxID=137722 RepID=UPI0001C4CF66|nr:DEAD/DEAH box helicase [Azospirillum sp. B510]BAI76700.1 SNF2 family DNA/RNA helicase [Azospirillum sp. B510]
MFASSDLRRLVDPGTFERGRAYWLEGRVKQVEARHRHGDSWTVIASVRGSGRALYKQDISVELVKGMPRMLDGMCDCPVGYNCKHVVAAMLAWAERPAAPPRPAQSSSAPGPLRAVVADQETKTPAEPELSAPLKELLARLDAAALRDSDSHYADTVRKRLLYLLSLAEAPSGGRQLLLRIVSVSLRKDGQFANDDKRYDLYGFNTLKTTKFVTPADHALLDAISRNGQRTSQDILLPSDFAPWLIGRMLPTGRLYWQDFREGEPLHPGPTLSGMPVWESDRAGNQRFVIGFEGRPAGTPPAIALPTVPLLYVDPAMAACGPVEAAVSPHIAVALLSAPPLPPGEVAAFRAEAERFGGRLPVLPDPPARAERRRIAPRPVLRLGLARPFLSSGYYRPSYGLMALPELAVADLYFDYAGTRLHWKRGGPPLQWMEDGTLVTAQRQRAEEKKAVQRLKEADLDHPPLPLSVGGAPPVREELFAAPGDEFEERSIWLNFCHFILPELRADGWGIEVAPDFPFEVLDAPKDWAFEVGDGSGIDWFSLSLGVDIGGERIDLLPILRQVIDALARIDPDLLDDEFHEYEGIDEPPASPGREAGLEAVLEQLAPSGTMFVRIAATRYIPLEVERLKPMIGVLMELFGLQAGGELRIGRSHLGDLSALEDAASAAGIPLLGADAVRDMGRALREAGGVPAVTPPQGLRATLRPYQQAGLDWLQFLGTHGFGGILADDMGLGKTVQALAHLLAEKEAGRLDRPSLLIAPTSVLGNWRAEVQRFAPALRTLVLQGPQRKEAHGSLADHDLVVTSYALLPRDREVLTAQPWHMAIFDEAQYLKNPAGQSYKAAQALEARQRLCLTGTPVENNLDELWALFAVCVPSLFGDRTGFRRTFRTPIEKHGDGERQRVLARRVRPFLLRRTKEQVAAELPPKTEILEAVEAGDSQRDLYETIRLTMDQRVREEVARKGLARSHITILDALLKLRQVCCDPRLVKLESARKRVAKGAASAKLDRLLEMLPELLADGRRILLFSQFTSMFDLMRPELERLAIPFVELTGDTRDRETPVNRFQAGEVPLFLISLKAGGTGLNLTAADTVIHYDPWWNPAVEDQATDRAHRIGQDKPVFVYKLVTTGTVEERMVQLQERKRRLGEAVYDQDRTAEDLLTADDLDFLLAPIDG